MNSNDPLDKLLKTWEPKSPHSPVKFAHDTLRAIRTRETRPAWRIAWDRWLERVDSLILEWLPSPRTLVPVAAALMLTLTIVRWSSDSDQIEVVAALRWQQDMSQPLGRSSLSGGYAQFMKE